MASADPVHDGPSASSTAAKNVVLVMGPGRSGTSTVAGALTLSGLAVPGVEVEPDDTNPVGFYEPQWVVDFHTRLLDRAQVAALDGDPDAFDLTVEIGSRPECRAELRDWLSDRLDEHPRLVVKDPRTVWFQRLWVETARDLGVELGFVTMLRHPAEVSASRARYYARDRADTARVDDVTRIGGWVNVALTTERVTRGSHRVFVRYADLLEDWRAELTRVQAGLSLTLDPAPDLRPHPVDSFIDPSLRRVQVDWADVALPDALRDLADAVWQALSDCADEVVTDEQRADTFDVLRERYLEMTRDAWALNRNAIRRAQVAARRRGRRQGRRRALQETQPPSAGKTGSLRGRLRGTR